MTKEEAKKMGATHYRKLSNGFFVYFKRNGSFFSSVCGSISYPRSFKEIKPL